MRQGVGEERFLRFERDVLRRVVEAGGVDLADLEAQQVELASAGPVVASEPGELGVDAPHLGAGCAVRGERVCRRRTGEPIERGALYRRRQEGLMGVLAVEVDEASTHLGELADGCEPPVDVSTAAPVQRHRARQDDLVAGAGFHESTLDARFGRAGACASASAMPRSAVVPEPSSSAPLQMLSPPAGGH